MTNMKELSVRLREILVACAERGMQLPFIVCAVSPNGSVLCIRTDGTEPEVLAEHIEQGMFKIPITFMVLDQTGEAVRISIEAERLSFH